MTTDLRQFLHDYLDTSGVEDAKSLSEDGIPIAPLPWYDIKSN